MKQLGRMLSGVAGGLLVFAMPAMADYETHPELRPENRCAGIPPTVAFEIGEGDNTSEVLALDWGEDWDQDGVQARYTSSRANLPPIELPDGDGGFFQPGPGDVTRQVDPGNEDSFHCQRLFWDLPATTEVGRVRVAAPYDEDPIPRFPRGDTDRIPPVWIADENGDGEFESGYETLGDAPTCAESDNATGCRKRLCPEGEVGWWKPVDEDGDNKADIGTDPEGERHAVDDPDTPEDESENLQKGPLYELACTRGTRAYFGPWQTAGDETVMDRLTSRQMLHFENTDLLAGDGFKPGEGRWEWNGKSEFYNHFASHHGTCWMSNPAGGFAQCNDFENPPPPDAFVDPQSGACDPEDSPSCGMCWRQSDGEGGYDWYLGAAVEGGGCHAADADIGCDAGPGGGAFRNATQVPGRLSVQNARNRGFKGVEDQIWMCNHHVVTQLPPGSYSMDRLANYRLQEGGLTNPRERGVNCELQEDDPETSIDETRSCDIYGVGPGETFGGSAGEMIVQYFTEDKESDMKPLNLMFNAAPDFATTWYPPFTWNYHTTLWFPPFDANITLTAIHSHHRMVKGTMDILPKNPERPNSPNPLCGGSKNGPAEHIYVNWDWEDARVCEYWRDPDGPVTIRKGEALATTCYVNNGVTPEAIKHGLVGGDIVEGLKQMGAPIPDYPELVPASTFGEPLADSPVGDELLYGTHPPINYRVVYKCSGEGVPGNSLPTSPVCDPNPKVDADGDYIDGPYRNAKQCGTTDGGEANFCEPSTIMFRCVGEDEMCIGVAAYYALPRVGSDRHEEAQGNLEENLTDDEVGNEMDGVGLPGAHPPSDSVAGGGCPECPETVSP